MSDRDPNTPPKKEVSQELVDRAEAYYLEFRAENDGKNPTREELRKALKISHSKSGPAAHLVEARLEVLDTELASMPAIPDEITRLSDRCLKKVWTAICALQSAEIVDVKRAQAAKDAKRDRQQEEDHQSLLAVEAERDEAQKRAEIAEERQNDLADLLDRTSKALVAAEARLAERDAIVELLKLQAEGNTPSTKAAKTGRKAPTGDDNDPETGLLPGITPGS